MPRPVRQTLTLEGTCPGPSGVGVQQEEEVLGGLPLSTVPTAARGHWQVSLLLCYLAYWLPSTGPILQTTVPESH